MKYPEAEQLDLSIIPPRLNPFQTSTDLTESFLAFHAANPGVYKMIRMIALDLRRRGFRNAGMKAIFEKLRWEYAIATRGEDYKLNNNLTSFYARLLMHREPCLRDFFRLREQRVIFDPSQVSD